MSATVAAKAARPAARRTTTASSVARHAPSRRPARPAPTRLRVVDTAAYRRVRRVRRAMCLLTGLVVGSLFAAVAFHVSLAEGQLALDRLGREKAAAQARYQKLRLEVAQQSSPQAIDTRARQLGMVPSPRPNYLEVLGAAPPAPPSDSTSTTLEDGWGKVKSHLGSAP